MSDQPRPVVCFLIDAFRHDYLDRDRSPWLFELAGERGFARMRPILGYSDSIRATIFTGAYPDQHGYWMEYCRRPDAAPMQPLTRLSALDRFPSELAKRFVKFGLSQTAVKRIARRRGYAELSVRNLPFRSLGQFDWTLQEPMSSAGSLSMPTIFDELSAAGRKWSYLDTFHDSRREVLRASDELDPDTSFVFVYLHQIDLASHFIGLESSLFSRVVRRVDALAAEIHRRISERIGEHDLIVFSDHGMSKVTDFVSFRDLWTHPAFPSQFCFALDATMIRLWHRESPPALRDEIRERVQAGAPGGRFLDAGELAELHLSLDGGLYGDEVYLLEPGTVVHPNFHSLIRPRAMHAYHPDDLEQHGILIGPPEEQLGEVAELVDVSEMSRRRLAVGGREVGVAG
jgi:hypothetical protein